MQSELWNKRISAEGAALKRGLVHPQRLEILTFLAQQQGGTEAELTGGLGIASGVVQYHLKVLEHAGLVVQGNGLARDAADRYFVPTSA